MGIAEICLRGRCAHETRERIRSKTTYNQNSDRNGQVWQPQEELPQDIRDRRQSERVKGDNERDEPDEPFGYIRNKPCRVGVYAGVAYEARKPRPLRHVVEADAAKKRDRTLCNERGNDPADRENDDEPDNLWDSGKEQSERLGNRGENRIAPIADWYGHHGGIPPRRRLTIGEQPPFAEVPKAEAGT